MASGKQSGRPSGTARGQRQAAGRDLERTYALAEVAQAVARVGTPEEWGARVVAAVARATGWSRVFVFRLVDPRAAGRAGEPPRLELLAAHGITPEQEIASRQLALDGPSASAQAVNTRAPAVVGRTPISEAGVRNLRGLGTASHAVFPLIARELFGEAQADMDRFERYLHTMDGQVDRLAHLVNDLLDVSRIRTARLALRLADVDLVALTATVLERFDTVSDNHSIAWRTRRLSTSRAWASACTSRTTS